MPSYLVWQVTAAASAHLFHLLIMGLYVATIRFPTALPAFATLQQHYYQQTGLRPRLVATVQLAASPASVPLLSTPADLTAQLQGDAAAVVALEARHAAEQDVLRQVRAYEQVAAARDQYQTALASLTHVSYVELMVEYGNFYAIEFSVKELVVTVHQYAGQEYAVDSLLKVLVDLGGLYETGTSADAGARPPRWRKLKRWAEYRWYNRPRK
jgi:hypothetical protein